MRKSAYTLNASRVPNNAEMVLAGMRLGMRTADELADYAGISRAQADTALSQLRADEYAEFRRDGANSGWYPTAEVTFGTVIVAAEAGTPWGVFGYPTSVIAPLVGRVHRLAG